MIDDNKKTCVLVVDDQPRIIRFIEIYLKLKGFDVISSTSGRKALDMIRADEPDIMLLDIVMPDMDGFELMKRLRGFSEVPVIAISASPEGYEAAMGMGVDDFIFKPFKTEDMLVRINHVLGLQAE